MPARLRIASALIAVAALAALPSAASADFGCERFASPTGSNANPGTAAAPVRSIARLIAITGPDEDGCLPAGSTFVEPIGSFIVDNAGGQPGVPARIRTDDPDAAPAVVKGAMWLKGGVHDVNFERIRFTDSPGNNDKGTMLVVHGDRIAFRYTEMTWRRGICLNAGYRNGYQAGDPAGTERTEGLVIEHSRIHDCGNDPAIVSSLRAAGQSGVHGIYLINAASALIRDNYIYDNVSRGIQFWPDVDGAVVEHNVFDGNGTNVNVGSSAAYGHFSEGNRFEDNIVSNAILRSVYDQPWGPGDTHSIVGHFPADGNTRGNLFAGNCIFQADQGLAYGGYGYSRSGDLFGGEPRYVDRAAADFRLRDDSPCAGKGPREEVASGNPVQVPPPAAAPEPDTEPSPAPPAVTADDAPAPSASSAEDTGVAPTGGRSGLAEPSPSGSVRAHRAARRKRHCRPRGRKSARRRAIRSGKGLRSGRRACQGRRDKGLPHRAVAWQGRHGRGV